MGENVAALDMGTSTLAGAYKYGNSGRAISIEFGNGSGFCEAKLAFDENNQPIIGADVDRAVAEGRIKPNKVIRNAKKLIGSEMVFSDAKGDVIRPEDAQAIFAKKVMEFIIAETHLKMEDVTIVFTYPVSMKETAKELYLKALQTTGGFNVTSKHFYNEALAALAGVSQERGLDLNGKNVLIVDIGGGTTDIVEGTVVEKDGELTVVLRSLASDGQLGGTNYDIPVRNMLVQTAQSIIPAVPASALCEDPAIKRESERIKRRLCDQQADQDYAFSLSDGTVVSGTILYEDFKTQTEDLTQTVISVCQKALDDAINDSDENLQKLGLERMNSVDDLDMVVFVGGGSKVPSIREAMIQAWPQLKDKINDSVDPQLVVSLGAAYLAGSSQIVSRAQGSYGARVRDSETNEVYGHIMIHHNDPLPATVKRVFYTPASTVCKTGLISTKNWPREKGDHAPLLVCRPWGEVSLDTPEAIEGEEVQVEISMEQNGFVTFKATVNGRETTVDFELADDVVMS